MMRLTHVVSRHKVLSFLVGVFLFQLSIIFSAIYFRSSTATAAVSDSDKTPSIVKPVTAPEVKPVRESAPAVSAPREITYKISAGDTLIKIWTKNGSTYAAGASAAEAFKKAGIPLNSLKLNEEVRLVIAPSGEITEFHKKLSEGKMLAVTGDSQRGYEAVVTQEKIVEKEKIVSSEIISSFSYSAQEASVPADIVDDLVDMFGGRLDFNRDLQPGDSFTVIYNERSTEGGEVLAPGAIKAISIENNGKLLVAMGHAGRDGVVRYFDENGQLIGNYFLRYPLRFTRISSVFSKSRFHPILQISRPHNGVDFAAPSGTPVRTVGDGVIEHAGYSRDCGNMIKIRHDSRYTTAYLHLSKISSGLKVGSRVSRGDVIGAVGMTGLATAPHLHFSLYDDDKFVDPLKAKLPSISPKEFAIPRTYLASTLQTLRAQHAMVRLASRRGLTPRV